MREAGRIRYGFVSVVYGGAFTRLMADVTLPTNLSPGNLPALAEDAEVTFHIYATHASQSMLRATPAFSTLETFARVIFHDIGSESIANASSPYEVLSACHQRAIRIARERDEALVVLSPDAIWSDGSFARMHEIVKQGARAVMMASPRASKSAFLGELSNYTEQGDDASLSISHRDLMACMLDNLHPYSENLLWREDRTSSWPSQLYWRAGKQEMLVRAFHLHPLVVRPTNWDTAIPETIDGRFVAAAVANRSDIHVVRDSDEIAACEMTNTLESRAHLVTPNRESGTKRIAAWMRRATDALHREYVELPIRLHAGPLDSAAEARFQQCERESARVLACIQRDYRALEKPPAATRTGDRPHVATQP
ncbi:MAG: hypothetical protein QF570_09175 [Myxococcota bacterium]|nr:hypothetical protein [Myxococcota bacterium]